MALRRLLYLAVLEALLVFYVAYREWFAWVVLVAVAVFPLLSLLLSLPGILTTCVRLTHAVRVPMGTQVVPEVHITCPLPAPLVRCRLKLRHSSTGTVTFWKENTVLPTEHCGVLSVIGGNVWVYDYLGLWRFPVRRATCEDLTVLPLPYPGEQIPFLQENPAPWRPKRYGFSENHELRPYRPGDDLRLLHPKLSAKTGKWIVREPMEQRYPRTVITLLRSAEPEQTDRDMGRLLWLSTWLLEKKIPHEIRCLTGGGMECCLIRDRDSLEQAMDCLLSAAPSRECTFPVVTDAGQHFHIGGDGDEE